MTPPRRPAPTAGPTWRDVEPTPLILLTGPEDYLAARARDRVRTALKDRRGPVELSTVDAAAYAPGQLAALASPSLFDDAKLIHVSNLAAMNDDCLADGLAYVQAPDPVLSRSFLRGLHSTTAAPAALRASRSFLPRLPPLCSQSTTTSGSGAWT